MVARRWTTKMAAVKTIDLRAANVYEIRCGYGTWSEVKAGTASLVLASAVDVYARLQMGGLGARAFQGQMSWDMSAIPPGSVIKSATLKLYGIDWYSNVNVQDLLVFPSTWDGAGNVVTGDYTVWTGLSATDRATDADYSFPIGSYGYVTNNLNAASLADLQAALGSGSFALMALCTDAVNEVGGGFDTETVQVDGVTNVPELTITYEPGNGIQLGVNI